MPGGSFGSSVGRNPWANRVRVAALLVLAPVCGEYLAAYDDSTGRPLALLGGLVILTPLYGAPALLIREWARRRGAGWRGILGLAAAAGLIQAGVIDQSLFSESYRGLDDWVAWRSATRIPGIGVSAHMLLGFVGGHVAFTFGAPIALVEALHPVRRTEPWLGGRGVAGALLAYVAAAALVLADHLQTEASHASPAEIAGSLAIAVVAGTWALRRPRRDPPAVRRSVPRPFVAGAIACVVASGVTMASETWLATLLACAALVCASGWFVRASRAGAWTPGHVIAVATGVLLGRALLAFAYFPLFGEVGAWRKYGHNVVMLLLVCALAALAARANRPGAAVR